MTEELLTKGHEESIESSELKGMGIEGASVIDVNKAIATFKVETLSPSTPTMLSALSNAFKTSDYSDLDIKVGKVSIEPFTANMTPNMGLEKYGQVMFDGVSQSEELACVELNHKWFYITGLDETSATVKGIKNKEERDAVIKNIRKIVAHLEFMDSRNVLDVDDVDFWSKVNKFYPTNQDYYSQISLKLDNKGLTLNYKEDVEHLVLLLAIEAGGFTMVAKSYEDAMSRPNPPKFYLRKEIDAVNNEVSFSKLQNKAVAKLENVLEENPSKLLVLTKVISLTGYRFNNHTPMNVLYKVCDSYIKGEGSEKNKKRAAENFIAYHDMDFQSLKIRSLVKDATYLGVISTGVDGSIYLSSSGTLLGRNLQDVYVFLGNPINEEIYSFVKEAVEGA